MAEDAGDGQVLSVARQHVDFTLVDHPGLSSGSLYLRRLFQEPAPEVGYLIVTYLQLVRCHACPFSLCEGTLQVVSVPFDVYSEWGLLGRD